MTEAELQIKVAEYLDEHYPDVQFHSDFGTGTRLRPQQAKRQKAMNVGRRGWPDLFIAKKKRCDGNERVYAGLFIELKREGFRLKKKNGAWIDERVAKQAEMICKLQDAGYEAHFAVGFEETKKIIDEYLGEG